jgi:chorismate mutase
LKVTLDELRERIDFLDKALLHIIIQRLALMPLVTQIKKVKNMPIHQEDREKRIYESLENFAKEHGLNDEFLKELYRIIIAESKKLENHLLNIDDKNYEAINGHENFDELLALFQEASSRLIEFNGFMKSIDETHNNKMRQETIFDLFVYLTNCELGES